MNPTNLICWWFCLVYDFGLFINILLLLCFKLHYDKTYFCTVEQFTLFFKKFYGNLFDLISFVWLVFLFTKTVIMTIYFGLASDT